MNLTIEIDEGSGFCFGVTTAIKKAEEELAKGNALYCLGDIVHNGMEVERLHEQGLVTINHDDLRQLHDVKVLLRAHGEPPETYALAQQNNIEIIDATCPVVLALQRRIKRQYDAAPDAQIVIFGKRGHAEVLGLVGQTAGKAIVVEKVEDVERLTGHPQGGVCPFALPEGVRVFLDESLKRYDVVYPAAGAPNNAVQLTPDELAAVTGGQWVDLCKLPEELA